MINAVSLMLSNTTPRGHVNDLKLNLLCLKEALKSELARSSYTKSDWIGYNVVLSCALNPPELPAKVGELCPLLQQKY